MKVWGSPGSIDNFLLSWQITIVNSSMKSAWRFPVGQLDGGTKLPACISGDDFKVEDVYYSPYRINGMVYGCFRE